MYSGEKFNSITHVVGAGLAVIGLVVLILIGVMQGNAWHVTAFSLYGGTLVLLYTSSALYHSFRGRAKAVFRKLDHGSIYLLIAGTYTPITLITLRHENPGWAWALFGIVWGLAVIGVVTDALPTRGKRILPLVLYILMGWLIMIAIKPLWQALPHPGLAWLLAGGLAYTLGGAFYVYDTKVKHFHGVWHLFVLLGSACHYIVVAGYVR